MNQLSFVSQKQFVNLKHLETLDLSNNKFTTFKPGLFTSNPIKLMFLGKNNIEILPDAFLAGNVSLTLRKLYLANNRLREIPHCIFQQKKPPRMFPKLEGLYLGENRIKELPSDLFNSTNWSLLKTLDLHRNSISNLHPSIFHSIFLAKLKSIDLSYNKVETFPTYFFHNPVFTCLTSLKLSHNKITFLANEFFLSPYLKNLSDIDLSYNQVSSIPSNFFKYQVQNLRQVYLNNNNLKNCH